MKKFLSILIMSMVVVCLPHQSDAQQASLLPLVAGDTISTTATKDTVSKVIPSTAGYSTLTIQVVTTKLSGTVAGKAYLMSCLDGVNYQVTDSSAAFADQTTNTIFFDKTDPGRTYYKVQVKEMGSATSTQGNIVRVYVSQKPYFTTPSR